MSEVKAAMSAEEWAACREYEALPVWVHNERGRHAGAAWALHGQSYGFTHEDVDALEAMADNTPGRGHRRTDFLYDLAARISALLPPREETT